jgi:hypothetical protein
MLHLVLVALCFAVFTNVGNDGSEFPDMRGIGRRKLAQCCARGNDVLNRFRARGQLPIALTQQR